MLLHDHNLTLDYYNTKKLIRVLGLAIEKIDVCTNDCMFCWKDDIDIDYCKFCRDARLYTLEAIVKHMMWQANHQIEDGSMCHRSDAKAWRHFERTYPDIAAKLGMCISFEYIFLLMVIPGPSNLNRLTNVYLEPWVEELQNLWMWVYRCTTMPQIRHS
ncbi:hypothetical protein Sango_1875200 [Sesamum angolense]|uniref:Uncharacterized protein n=1 Tax=Sesamum angolense TaxID=2727404 RepID=A0AAE1WIN5_9LAMI|nr:hypothetical protein Sango_1875200 [Sesamum angolense]